MSAIIQGLLQAPWSGVSRVSKELCDGLVRGFLRAFSTEGMG